MAVARKPKPRAHVDSTGNSVGYHSDAHPTAPGGMSQAALRTELAEVHDIGMNTTRGMAWPDLIDAVCQGRLDREKEAKARRVEEVAKIAATHPNVPEPEDWSKPPPKPQPKPEVPFVPVAEDDEDDFSDLDFLDDEPEDEESDALTAVNYEDPSDIPEAKSGADQDDETEAIMAEFEAGAIEAEAEKPPPLFIGMPDTLDYMFSGHAGASPSGAERWVTCTASLGASRKFLETLTPNQQVQFAGANTAARQGTTAHAAAEAKVGLMMGTMDETEVDAALMELTINPVSEEEAYDSEMDEHLNEYVDYVKQLHDAGHELLIEERVRAAIPLTDLHEGEVHEIPGSGDCIALPTPEENVLTVADLKYGDGIDVTVEANPQVRIYALGALALLIDDEGYLPDLDRVDYVIVQPRLGGIKVWTESVEDLLAWRDDVLAPALTKALFGVNEGATYNPTDEACQWCPAKGSCAALAEQRYAQAAEAFDVVLETEVSGNPLDIGALSDDRLGELLLQITRVVSIKDDLKEEAQRRLHRGTPVAGFELVNYTPPRKWTEEAASEIEHELAGDIPSLYKPKALLTPTQAIKVLGEQAELIAHLIDAPPRRPVIAAIERGGDKRKKWEGRPPEDMFGDLADDHTPEAAPAAADMFDELGA